MADQPLSKTALLRLVFRIAGVGFLVLCALSALVIVLGPLLFRDPEDCLRWQAWRVENYGYLLIWRLVLYSVLVVAWLKLKARLGLNSSLPEHKQVRRIETLMILLLLMIELIKATR